MSGERSAEAPSPVSCAGSGRRGAGTWLRVVAVGLLAFLATGAVASEYAASSGAEKYGGFRQFKDRVRFKLADINDVLKGRWFKVYWEMNSVPPKPLQVFEYGPSRPAFMRNPDKYKYQYVCVVATDGPVQEGIWHRRRAPIRWTRQPPFHVRIVRPNPAGMLDYMMSQKKIRLAKKDVTITRTDKRTGQVKEWTRPMTIVERIDSDKMPKHIAEMLQAMEEGREVKDPRRTKGRWGPSNIPKAKEEGVRELLKEAGIETPEEMEDVTKVIDTETGEKFDLRRLFRFSETARGSRRLDEIASDVEREKAKEAKRVGKRRRK